MKVVLLAAGKSNRMTPIEDKSLLGFSGKTLVERQVDMLKRFSLKDIIIVSRGSLGEIKKLIGDALFVKQKDEKGMAGAVLSCEKYIGTSPFILISVNDVIEEKAFAEFLSLSYSTKSDGVILGKKVDTYFPGGYLCIGNNRKIKSIIEKPSIGKEPSGIVNVVYHFHKNSKKLFEVLKKTKSNKDDIYEKSLDFLFKNLNYVYLPFSFFWQGIKYPWNILPVMNFFLGQNTEKIDKSIKKTKNVVIRGKNIVIRKNVKICENAVIVGPCYIGENSIVGNSSVIRGSFIGKNCVIGFSSEITRSYLRDNVWTHLNYLGDSVVDSNVSFGAGTVTSNLRLDEKNIYVKVKGVNVDTGINKLGVIAGKNSRFGVNISVSPGIIVGKNSFISPSLILNKNIPDNSYVKVKNIKNMLIIKKNIFNGGKIRYV